MKITFVHAPEEFYDQNYGTQFIPLWAFYLASYVSKDWEVDLIDCRLESIEKATDSDVFAFGGINQSLQTMLDAKNRLKEKFPNACYLMGGPITWSFQKENKLNLLDSFDYLFVMDGEQALSDFLDKFKEGKHTIFPRIIQTSRYPVSKSREMSFDLFDKKKLKYYGAVVEVSRGCPFLCEFCDIRVLPDNNKANNRSIEIIIKEMDEFYKRGITQFQFACDNFIGDIKWAEECVDAILEWKESINGDDVAIFTWLTINLFNYDSLMAKMRKAGFGILFIGIESVNQNSLLETAKVQNMNLMSEAVEKIQSYGFVIAPGLIFGFDNDDDKVFQDTLDFLKDTGCVGGDPSFLTALAGTPLFTRMKKSGRLIERTDKAVERKKIATNIRYLQNTDMLSKGFLYFVKEFTSTKYQYERIQNTFKLIKEKGNYIGVPKGGSYTALLPYLLLQLKNTENLEMLLRRVFYLLRPDRLMMVLLVRLQTFLMEKKYPGVGSYFSYWAYNWTNLHLKYGKITMNDFGLHSVDENFDYSLLVNSLEMTDDEEKEFKETGVKFNVQAKRTKKAIEKLVENKKKERLVSSDV